jgi:hypothetical protein
VKSAKTTASKKGKGSSKGKGRVSSKNENDFKSILRLSVVTEMLVLCLCERDGEQTDLPFAECQELQVIISSCFELILNDCNKILTLKSINQFNFFVHQ